MQKAKLGRTGVEIAPLVLGGNVFGWTADQETSFALLDAFVDRGFSAVDSANIYSRFIPGNEGGESETVIGNWLAARKRREDLFLVTKVGGDMGGGRKGLKADQIVAACDESLQRLKTDYIDLYFSHFPDTETPIEETLEGHYQLVKAGKVRFVGASNYDAAGLKTALEAGEADGRASYDVIQPQYNLLTRDDYEGPLETLCEAYNLGVIPYFALAMGFLTGKYRSEEDLSKSPRGGRMKEWFTDRNMKLLDQMETVAKAHDATMAQVALAWINARPSVTAPIASATNLKQLDDIMGAAELRLSAAEVDALNAS